MTAHTSTMRAAFLHGHLDVRIEPVPVPEIERPDEVKIAIDYAGICGSELHMIDMTLMVAAAFRGSGGRKAFTPLEITSMPVTAVHPAAKARQIRKNVRLSSIGAAADSEGPPGERPPASS